MIQASSPRATVLFLAYNQAEFVETAALAVLEQQSEPLEILLSDDASTDETFAILQRVAAGYQGPHTVRVRRNARNLGIGAHYNVLVEEALGQLLITAAGDDISVPHRAATLLAAWDARDGRADLVVSDLVDMTYEGILKGTIEVDDPAAWQTVDDWAQQRPYVVGAAHAFTRRLWERFGPMATDVVYEDQVITLRAILAGGGVKVSTPLVWYRRGGTSATRVFENTAAFLRKTRALNQRSLAEQRQLLSDAQVAGREATVRAGLRIHLQREALIAALLETPRANATWQALCAGRDLSWSWRLRKWLYLRCPAIGSGVRRIQYWTKRLRRGS